MQMIHSCQGFAPDLASPGQLAQAEQNWPGLGATDTDLAAWARLYGTACLDIAADAAEFDADKSCAEGYDVTTNEARESLEELAEVKRERDGAEAEAQSLRDCMNAVAWALEDLAADDPLSDLIVLARRLRDGV